MEKYAHSAAQLAERMGAFREKELAMRDAFRKHVERWVHFVHFQGGQGGTASLTGHGVGAWSACSPIHEPCAPVLPSGCRVRPTLHSLRSPSKQPACRVLHPSSMQADPRPAAGAHGAAGAAATLPGAPCVVDHVIEPCPTGLAGEH